METLEWGTLILVGVIVVAVMVLATILGGRLPRRPERPES